MNKRTITAIEDMSEKENRKGKNGFKLVIFMHLHKYNGTNSSVIEI